MVMMSAGGAQTAEEQVMQFRKLLLRVVFISLAAAALFGAAGVLLASRDVTWRVTGTCVATAVAALLMLWVTHQLEKDPAALSGPLAAGLVAIEYVLVLAEIWDLIPSTIFHDDQLALTMFFIAVDGVPAIVLVHLMKRPWARVMARVGIPLCAVNFVLFMAAVVEEHQWPRSTHFYQLGTSMAVFAALAVMALAGSGTDRRYWRWVGVFASAVAMAMAFYAILNDIHGGSVLFTAVVCIAAVVAHANLMMLCPLKPNQRWLGWGTIGFGALTGVFVIGLRVTHAYWTDNEVLLRLSGACAILAGCGTLAMLVLARLNRKVTAPTAAVSELKQIALACPLCGKKQTLAAGQDQCSDCGLIIAVSLQEPRCRVCGYSLLMLKSDRCPECGAAVTESAPTMMPQAT